MKSSSLDLSPEGITQRLRRTSAQSDLAADKRLDAKLDMSAAAVTARLRETAALLELCRILAAVNGVPERSSAG